MKDKGRRDYTLNPTSRGPTNRVQFRFELAAKHFDIAEVRNDASNASPGLPQVFADDAGLGLAARGFVGRVQRFHRADGGRDDARRASAGQGKGGGMGFIDT